MEVVIKFNNEEGEEEHYMTALNGWKYRAVLFDLTQLLRAHAKGWASAEFSPELIMEVLDDKLQEHAIKL